MRRTYELALVLDPGLADDEQVSLVDDVKKMITGSGAEIAKEESWGKRKLAYPIHKFSEGRYVFLYVIADGAAPPFQEVERRLNQNERVLRYLTIRTDEDLRRALRKGKRPPVAAEAVGMAPPRTGPGGFDEPRRSDVEPRRSDLEPRRSDAEPRRSDSGREN
jgi:small subunit ribosomal protein S6